MFFKKSTIILLCLSAFVSNTYLIVLNNKYEQVYNNKSKICTKAVIISDKKEKEYVDEYIIKVKEGKFVNKKFILYTKKNDKNALEYGDLIYIEGKYLEPSKSRNYKSFDYAKYLKSRNIYGTISSSKVNIQKSKVLNPVLIKSNEIRNAIISKANRLLPAETSGLLLGILIGNKEEIQEETLQNFRKANLSHILAVSGMHTSYVILRNYLYLKKK